MYRCTHVYVHEHVHVQFDTLVDYGIVHVCKYAYDKGGNTRSYIN